MALHYIGRVIQHVCEGRQKSDRLPIMQFEVHSTTPHGAERPFVLKGGGLRLAADRTIIHWQLAYIVNGEFVAREQILMSIIQSCDQFLVVKLDLLNQMFCDSMERTS
jgi:hypothetical protein